MAIDKKILEEAVKMAVDAELRALKENKSGDKWFDEDKTVKKYQKEAGEIDEDVAAGTKYRKKNKSGAHRAEVITWLNDPAVDCAEIARQLWPHKKEASRRSYFYKCRDHKDNGKGGTHDFNNRDYRRLYAILTSGNK